MYGFQLRADPGDQSASRWATHASVAALTVLTLLLGACGDSVGSVGPREWVAFVREPSYDTIFVADPESGAIDQKIVLPMRAPRFRFSPAGDRLAIVSGGDLWVMNPDASDARRLVPGVMNIAWSSDGARIAYVRSSLPRELHIVNADGSGDVVVPGATPDGWGGLAWSPDGTRIAFEGIRDMVGPGATITVYVIDTDGTGLRDIDAPLPGPDGRAVHEPAWSPDGRLIAINRLMYFHTPDQEQNLWLTNVANGDGWRVTTGRTDDVRESWSSNGDRIAFLRYDGDLNDVYIVGYDGTGLRRITDTPEREEDPQFWRRR